MNIMQGCWRERKWAAPGVGKGSWGAGKGSQGEASYFRVLLETMLLPEGRRVWHKYHIINAENSCWKGHRGRLRDRQIWELHTPFVGLEDRVETCFRIGAWCTNEAGSSHCSASYLCLCCGSSLGIFPWICWGTEEIMYVEDLFSSPPHREPLKTQVPFPSLPFFSFCKMVAVTPPAPAWTLSSFHKFPLHHSFSSSGIACWLRRCTCILQSLWPK